MSRRVDPRLSRERGAVSDILQRDRKSDKGEEGFVSSLWEKGNLFWGKKASWGNGEGEAAFEINDFQGIIEEVILTRAIC